MIICSLFFSIGITFFEAFFIKRGIKSVEVALIQFVGQQSQIFTEALVVDNFAFAQKPDRVFHVGVVCQPQNIVIRAARLLF